MSDLERTATFTADAVDELKRIRIRRDELRSERGRLDRELATADDVVAALLRLRPDLRDRSDASPVGTRGRRTELAPRLSALFRERPDVALPIPTIMVELERTSRAGQRKPSTSQVRNALRYLAKTSADIQAERDAQNRLAYRFRASSAD